MCYVTSFCAQSQLSRTFLASSKAILAAPVKLVFMVVLKQASFTNIDERLAYPEQPMDAYNNLGSSY